MRRIGPLSLALVLCVLAGLAAPPPSHSVLTAVFCSTPVPSCYVDQDCNAYCQSSCPATPRGVCQIWSRLGDGFCMCDQPLP